MQVVLIYGICLSLSSATTVLWRLSRLGECSHKDSGVYGAVTRVKTPPPLPGRLVTKRSLCYQPCNSPNQRSTTVEHRWNGQFSPHRVRSAYYHTVGWNPSSSWPVVPYLFIYRFRTPTRQPKHPIRDLRKNKTRYGPNQHETSKLYQRLR